MAVSQIDPNGLNVGQLGSRNMVINGAMVFDQRNGAAAISSLVQYTTYTLDRWQYYSDQAGKFSFQQNQSSVTPPVGFTKYLGLTSLSAYSPGTNETVSISQHVEGFNSAQLNWGTSNAKTVSLSFWVRSSLTGTFSGVLAGGQNYIYTYAISSANTWEYKTITVPGSTTGTWNTGNTSGVRVFFTLGYGSGQVGTANAWQSADFAASGSVQVVGTSGATFQITGVQLEVSPTGEATPFEHRSSGEEMALCERYFQKVPIYGESIIGQAYNTTSARFPIHLPVEMRASPALTVPPPGQSGNAFKPLTLSLSWPGGTGNNVGNALSNRHFYITCTNYSGLAAGNASTIYANSNNVFITASAEL